MIRPRLTGTSETIATTLLGSSPGEGMAVELPARAPAPASNTAAITPAISLPEITPETNIARVLEADDGSRTRDLELGKLALYQLSYVRMLKISYSRAI